VLTQDRFDDMPESLGGNENKVAALRAYPKSGLTISGETENLFIMICRQKFAHCRLARAIDSKQVWPFVSWHFFKPV
jgi:hypothetical protein